VTQDDSGADDAMIRSEERLVAGAEQEVTGKVRMRKHVVTEYVTVTVPVRHEKVRLETVPPGEDDGADESAGEAEESGAEMVLYAERPVVTTETVPVERVRLGKQIVTEEETVTGPVRKERIELDRPD
jgi:uncharacterized protein (TIGR02271 family)